MGFTQYFYIGQRLVVNFTHSCEQILLNCIYVLPNTRSIPIRHNLLDPTTVFPFRVNHQELDVSRD